MHFWLGFFGGLSVGLIAGFLCALKVFNRSIKRFANALQIGDENAFNPSVRKTESDWVGEGHKPPQNKP
jgi:hypothetical protein